MQIGTQGCHEVKKIADLLFLTGSKESIRWNDSNFTSHWAGTKQVSTFGGEQFFLTFFLLRCMSYFRVVIVI